MKSYTDLEQSRKLAEILPLESADNYYSWHDERYYVVNKDCPYPYSLKEKIHCWSLASLLCVLPKGTDIIKEESDTENEHYMCTVGIKGDIMPAFGNNPVDACVGMIGKLHELNLL